MLNNQGTLGSIGFTSMPDPFFGFVIHGIQTRKGAFERSRCPSTRRHQTAVRRFGQRQRCDGRGFGNGQIDPLTGFPEFEAVSFSGVRVTELGNFGGNGGNVNSINNRGQIVGYVEHDPDPYGCLVDGLLHVWLLPTAQQMRAAPWAEGR